MSDILPIAQMVNPKSYVNQGTVKPDQQSAQMQGNFNIVDLAKVLKPNNKDDYSDNSFLENQRQLLSEKFFFNLIKDPGMAAGALKGIFNSYLVLALTGDSKVTSFDAMNELAKALSLDYSQMLGELFTQAEGISMFKGQFYDIIRLLYSSSSDGDFKHSIINLLKAISVRNSNDDVLSSLKLNIQNLMNYLPPHSVHYNRFSNILDVLSGIILNKGNFQQTSGEASTNANNQGKEEINLNQPTDSKNNANTQSNTNTNINSNQNTSTTIIANLLKNADMSIDKNPNEQLNNNMQNIDNTQVDENKNVVVNSILGKTNEVSKEEMAKRILTLLNQTANKDTFLNAEQIKEVVEKLNIKNPNWIESFEIIRNSITFAVQNLQQSPFNSTSTENLCALIMYNLSYLNNTPSNVDDSFIKVLAKLGTNQELSVLLAEAYGDFVEDTNNSQNKQSSLIKTISKFINTFYSQNKANVIANSEINNVLRSLIAAPNSFTPLLHFMLPMRYENTQGFGELWVDPYEIAKDKKGKEMAERAIHVFFVADIMDIGYFEIEVYLLNNKVSVSLYCPPDHVESFKVMKDRMSKAIAATTNYSFDGLNIDKLVRKRSLPQVFSKLTDKRDGFNVSI